MHSLTKELGERGERRERAELVIIIISLQTHLLILFRKKQVAKKSVYTVYTNDKTEQHQNVREV